jgi:dienelactone hydrolase
MPERYHKEASDHAWAKVLDFLQQTLAPDAPAS